MPKIFDERTGAVREASVDEIRASYGGKLPLYFDSYLRLVELGAVETVEKWVAGETGRAADVKTIMHATASFVGDVVASLLANARKDRGSDLMLRWQMLISMAISHRAAASGMFPDAAIAAAADAGRAAEVARLLDGDTEEERCYGRLLGSMAAHHLVEWLADEMARVRDGEGHRHIVGAITQLAARLCSTAHAQLTRPHPVCNMGEQLGKLLHAEVDRLSAELAPQPNGERTH